MKNRFRLLIVWHDNDVTVAYFPTYETAKFQLDTYLRYFSKEIEWYFITEHIILNDDEYAIKVNKLLGGKHGQT